jgi:hypothetical protein
VAFCPLDRFPEELFFKVFVNSTTTNKTFTGVSYAKLMAGGSSVPKSIDRICNELRAGGKPMHRFSRTGAI